MTEYDEIIERAKFRKPFLELDIPKADKWVLIRGLERIGAKDIFDFANLVDLDRDWYLVGIGKTRRDRINKALTKGGYLKDAPDV